jgi:hypothetical protein
MIDPLTLEGKMVRVVQNGRISYGMFHCYDWDFYMWAIREPNVGGVMIVDLTWDVITVVPNTEGRS